MKDMTGKRFGRLLVVERAPGSSKRGISWICKCDCGNVTTVNGIDLRRGDTRSCGCLHSERISTRMTTHGHTIGKRERLYGVWGAMLSRTTNPNATNYQWYGGRGIRVCPEWHDYSVFREWAYSAGYDESAQYGQCTLDRIDDNGDYTPDNCRWVSMARQANNQRTNVLVTIEGETHNLKEWSVITGINYSTIKKYNKQGIVVEKITESLK